MTIQYCIEQGIEPSRIHIVDPVRKTQLFSAPLLDILNAQLSLLEITRHEGIFKSSYIHDSQIVSLSFSTKDDGDELVLEDIDLFLDVSLKSLDPTTFKAIIDANLVYDENIIIDNLARTTDAHIFAIGPATRHKVTMQTGWKHGFCDSREVGDRLASFLLHLFDPTTTIDDTLLKAPHDDYVQPLKVYARFPGLTYLHYDIPQTSTFVHPADRRDLVLAKESENWQIRVDAKGYIYSQTYLGPRMPSIENMTALYGVHERYLNRMVARFDEGVILDFMDFFNEPWAFAVVHDRFPIFIEGLLGVIDEVGGNGTEIDSEKGYEIFDQGAERGDWDRKVFGYLMETGVFEKEKEEQET